MYYYAFGAKSLQVRVSLSFFNPPDDAHWVISVKMTLMTKMVNYLTNIVIMRSCAGKGRLKEGYNRMSPAG